MWFRDQTASWPGSSPNTSWQDTWQDFIARTRGVAADEAELRRKFWAKVKREAAALPFLEELLTAHYCAFDRHTPFYVKAILIAAIVYFLVPDDFIPASIPIIGYADDAAVLAGAFKIMSSHIKPEHREAARRKIEELRRA